MRRFRKGVLRDEEERYYRCRGILYKLDCLPLYSGSQPIFQEVFGVKARAGERYSPYQCASGARVMVNGKPYCKVHAHQGETAEVRELNRRRNEMRKAFKEGMKLAQIYEEVGR